MATSLLKNITSNIFRHGSRTISPMVSRPCDVFINHRGIDTKRTVAGLLYDSLSRLNIQPFLDSETMKPGDKLFDKINAGIKDCKIGVAVLSPNYCDSYFCLHELALIMELKKKVIPIFCDIKPSDLHVLDNGRCSISEMQRFRLALEEARYTVGITFDSQTG
ncbi:Disease resistance protein (TIR-NBS class) [Thalictrum thalictroides]|uniref:Disease resistance protein (TIR-NBS class) n=1 Tax=Thalictrum thalictroides TaxID=46969 RepID=A0A7J6VZH0_THATH|nr:Disease resistance protein (TIR-NBS class) [Thalictrum thalictroides]